MKYVISNYNATNIGHRFRTREDVVVAINGYIFPTPLYTFPVSVKRP